MTIRESHPNDEKSRRWPTSCLVAPNWMSPVPLPPGIETFWVWGHLSRPRREGLFLRQARRLLLKFLRRSYWMSAAEPRKIFALGFDWLGQGKISILWGLIHAAEQRDCVGFNVLLSRLHVPKSLTNSGSYSVTYSDDWTALAITSGAIARAIDSVNASGSRLNFGDSFTKIALPGQYFALTSLTFMNVSVKSPGSVSGAS